MGQHPVKLRTFLPLLCSTTALPAGRALCPRGRGTTRRRRRRPCAADIWPVRGAVSRSRRWATTVFDEHVAWLATQSSTTAVSELLRIAWRAVGAIITRVWADVEALHDRFAELPRIGIDETIRGTATLTVVVDHDTGRLVWPAPGRGQGRAGGGSSTPSARERCAGITHGSAGAADWISTVVANQCVT